MVVSDSGAVCAACGGVMDLWRGVSSTRAGVTLGCTLNGGRVRKRNRKRKAAHKA